MPLWECVGRVAVKVTSRYAAPLKLGIRQLGEILVLHSRRIGIATKDQEPNKPDREAVSLFEQSIDRPRKRDRRS